MAKYPILLVHGGAGSRAPVGPKKREIAESLARVLEDSYVILKKGGSAAQAVVRAVELLENDPLYNAGYGSKIQSDGHIRMSASFMDGASGQFSGCVNVEGLKNPIQLAKALNHFKFRVLAGRGAEAYAREKKLVFASPFTERARRHFQRQKTKFGTVGAVAIDKKGRLAAATSTGGRGYEWPHRVSDSPTVAGNYANADCAVSATGFGEQIIDFAAAARLCTLVESGVTLDHASRDLIKKARKVRAEFGFIALSKDGYEMQTTTKHLIWGLAQPAGVELHP